MPIPAGTAYRIRTGNYVVLQINSEQVTGDGISVYGRAVLQYDDGEIDFLDFPQTTIGGQSIIGSTKAALRDGWVNGLSLQYNSPSGGPLFGYIAQNSTHVTAAICADAAYAHPYEVIADGFFAGQQNLLLGVQNDHDNWAVYAFQGTLTSDATVGTHVVTLTIKTFKGTELEFLYGQIVAVGAAASAQSVVITDGTSAGPPATNVLATLFTGSAAGTYNVPFMSTTAANASAGVLYRISGGMQLVLTSTTSTVSSTQTFSVVCRIRRGLPAATLADNTGTPTQTVNTSRVF